MWFSETSGFLVSGVVSRQPNADQRILGKARQFLKMLTRSADTIYGAYVVHVSTILRSPVFAS